MGNLCRIMIDHIADSLRVIDKVQIVLIFYDILRQYCSLFGGKIIPLLSKINERRTTEIDYSLHKILICLKPRRRMRK